MPVTKQSPLELFIKSYLKQGTRRGIQRSYALKAAALIDEKLGYCCEHPTSTISLTTRFDNNFSNTVRMLLNTVPLQGNKQSLLRTKAILDKFLFCCAAEIPTGGVVDDAANTFSFDIASGYEASDYEYTLDGGTTWSTPTSDTIPVGDTTRTSGQVGVRLKKGSHGGKFHNVSPILYNETDYNEGVAPDAPTSGVTNDTTNTFDWTNNPDFTALSDYEYTLNGGTSYTTVTAKPIVVGDVTKAAGQVGVRVKAVGGEHVSETLFDTVGFNAGVAPSAPTTPVTDDALDTFGWTDAGGKTFADAEYTVNGGTSYADATANPQTGITGAYAAGQVGVRYKAAGGNPVSSTLFNDVDFTA